jgi:hypothetical protein
MGMVGNRFPVSYFLPNCYVFLLGEREMSQNMRFPSRSSIHMQSFECRYAKFRISLPVNISKNSIRKLH